MPRGAAPEVRPPTRRKPLTDATSRANSASPADVRHKPRGPSSDLPHNVSIVPNGTLAVRNPDSSVDINHTSIVTSQEQRDDKRNSAISNTSTNASDTPRRRKSHIGPWQLGMTIGKGGCSRVRMVRHTVTGQFGAAKIISKAIAEKGFSAQSLMHLIESAKKDMPADSKVIPFGLEREIAIMMLMEHKNIVRLYDVWENRNELYLIMEYVQGGELFHYITERGGLEELEVVYLFRQIVAALLYCHRIHIHHRDLKPENILLDRSNLQIKLVDFGMAALQPKGRYLSTPCGSPHYAAPEVIKMTPYDGAKADVWSCGVILYVMLTGLPPFRFQPETANDMRKMFQAIARAEYEMPSDLSREAQDLIRRILVPNPDKRLDMTAVWNHPFLHKYDKDINPDPEVATIEYWIGPQPQIDGWAELKPESIDRELLRQMRTLWHSEKEEVLMARLLNKEANQEKLFYQALLRCREEYLENYSGSRAAVGYSTSDYQHFKAPGSDGHEPMPSSSHLRSKSAFSIMNDEHLHSKHSFYEPPPSDISYDPFRASRDPLLARKEQYMNVTVHRGQGGQSARKRASASGQTSKTPSTLRVEQIKHNNRRGSRLSTSTASIRSPTANRRSTSKISMTSSVWPSSPPIIVRSGDVHKRGVSFNHLRKASQSSRLTDDRISLTPEQRRALRYPTRQSSAATSQPPPSSPIVGRDHIVRSAKERLPVPVAKIQVKKPATPSIFIEKEARKVSTELDKLCEEAFYRSSVCSSDRTSFNDKPSPYETDTPPTSFSNRSSGNAAYDKPVPPEHRAISNRPLPPIPVETPKTFMTREIAETRERVAKRYAEEGDTANFKEVLSHLDRLLHEVPRQPAGASSRATSAPAYKRTESPGYLPIISEEGRFTDAENDLQQNGKGRHYGKRAVTDPVRKGLAEKGKSASKEDKTIRMVEQSPSTTIAPLNIRKVSGASTQASMSTATRRHTSSAPFTVHEDETRTRLPGIPTVHPPKFPSPEVAGKTDATQKKRSWFRRKVSNNNNDEDTMTTSIKIPTQWQALDDRTDRHLYVRKGDHEKKPSDESSEFPMRPEAATAGNKQNSSFWKRFGKRNSDQGRSYINSPASTDSLNRTFDLPYGDSDRARAASGADQGVSWFARILNIKPASKTLCFQVGRGKARQEVVRLLKEWKKFGIRDVQWDRNTNVVLARVDKQNHLKIKPVSFVAELFVVLEHGRRANLCAMRFTQTKGAASSFRKVVETVEDVFAGKGLLVEDEEKRRGMEAILG